MVKRFVLVAAAAAAAVRAECDYTAITDLTTSTEYTQCYADTNGYAFSSSYYDADTTAAICASSACEKLFNELSSIDLTDCGISTGDYDTLYKQACDSDAYSPTASSSNTSSGDSSGGSNTGLIIGLIAGGVVLLLLIGGFVFLRKRRSKQRELADQQELSVIGDNGYKLEAAETSDQVFHQVASAPRYDTASTGTGTQYSASVSRSQSHQSAVSTTSSNASNLWDDPVIIAARIPFQSVQLLSCISRGGFGEVYRAVYRDKPVAVKMLLQATRKDLHHISAFLSEIKLAAGLDHPNIVQFVGVAWESLSELYYVNEFVDGGDLRTLLASYQSTGHPYGMGPTELKIAMQVSNALTYLHSLQPMVLHRDLKSRNILLTAQLDAKITDFGASKERLDRTLTAGVGTSLWMAPEVVLGDRYDDKADVYSLGVVLFELDTHELPYDRSRTRGDDSGPLPEAAILQLVLMGRLRLEFSPALAPELRELGGKCLNVDPKQRPSAAQVAYELHTALRARTA